MIQPSSGARIAAAAPPLPNDPGDAAQQLLNAAKAGGGADIAQIASRLSEVRARDPQLADSIRAHVERNLSPSERGELSRAVDRPSGGAVEQGPGAGELALDITQIALDIAGIFDPTPVSDGSNAVISLFRGDFAGAGLSVVGFIPYIGDAAKLGKLGKWGETIAKAVDFARVNPGFAKQIAPALEGIAAAIRKAPLDKLPAGARNTLEGIATKIEGHLAEGKRIVETARTSGIPEARVREIVATPKGQRPSPSSYMSDADIAAHLKPFQESGAVRFTSKSGVAKYGTLGPANGTFTIPRSDLDRVLKETGGDLSKVEQRLGLDAGTLSNGDTLIAYIKPGDLNNLRVPSGNEAGANTYWVPGGRTSGGVPEATVDVPAGTRYTPITLAP